MMRIGPGRHRPEQESMSVIERLVEAIRNDDIGAFGRL
jgi:hypothetical protein